MKWSDALKIGLLVMAQFHKAINAGIPLPVNFSLKIGKKRLTLKGTVSAEDA